MKKCHFCKVFAEKVAFLCYNLLMEKKITITQSQYEKFLALEEILKEKEAYIAHLEELLKLKNNEKFCKKSETQDSIYPLLDDIETSNKIGELEEKIANTPETITKEKPKKVKSRNFVNDIDESLLPVEEVHMTIEKEGYRDINSDEIVKRLIYIPAQYKILKIVIHKYEVIENGERKIVRAENTMENPLGKTNVSSSLVSHIIYDKIVKSLPLYRQEKDLNTNGIPISRQCMANFIYKASEIIEPIFEGIKNEVKNAEFNRSDETPLLIINNGKVRKSASSNCYVWVFSTCKKYNPATIYCAGTRQRSVLTDFFGMDKKRYIMSDAYEAYIGVENVKNVFCLAHLRRKFTDVVKVDNKNSYATHVINLIAKIYENDNAIRVSCGNNFEAIKEQRNQIVKPLYDELFDFIEKINETVIPKSPLGKACAYGLKHKDGYFNVFEDGCLEIDNNASERKVKDFVIGRKNWLFSNTEDGAKITCQLYSILRTAIDNNLNPESYLNYLIDTLGNDQSIKDFTDFMPWSNKMQSMFKF